MALVEIVARFSCDQCGVRFSVEIDPAYKPPDDWTCFDIAEDAARGGLNYRGPDNASLYNGSSSVQDGRHLCVECTSIEDQKAQPEE